jgi:hypothetical protein
LLYDRARRARRAHELEHQKSHPIALTLDRQRLLACERGAPKSVTLRRSGDVKRSKYDATDDY